MRIEFEWNELKNVANFKKHGVWFEEAKTVWADTQAIEVFDTDHSDVEDRFLRFGRTTRNNFLIVVFCERAENRIRIISARKMTSKERQGYEEGI